MTHRGRGQDFGYVKGVLEKRCYPRGQRQAAAMALRAACSEILNTRHIYCPLPMNEGYAVPFREEFVPPVAPEIGLHIDGGRDRLLASRPSAQRRVRVWRCAYRLWLYVIVFLVLDFAPCGVRVGRLRRAKAAIRSCVRKYCRRAEEERMLPEHPCARRLQQANTARSDRMRGDCESECCQKATMCKTTEKRKLPEEAVCGTITKSERCQKRLCARGLRGAKAATSNCVQEDCRTAGGSKRRCRKQQCARRL